MGTSEDFFEEDEPVERVVEAFRRGPKRRTVAPHGLTVILRVPGLYMLKLVTDPPTRTSGAMVDGLAG